MKVLFFSKTYFSRAFWVITSLKILSGTFFASHYVMKGFLPFVKYFLETGRNPYDYFYSLSQIVFPYPTGMLLVISLFLYPGIFILDNLFWQPFLSLLLFRIPILTADIIIYCILCKLLPSKEDKVLWLYYASPILFYINYYHGQLDVIPTAFLIVSLYFLNLKKYVSTYLILGAGIATKTHLSIVLPFYAIYLYTQGKKITEISLYTIYSLLIFAIVNFPMLTSSYVFTVFNNAEQQRLFFVVLPYGYKELSLLISPAAILFCFYMFATNKRLNFDSLILMLGLVFTILIALVPPMQGWFYWSLPLFIFFLIKYKDSHSLSFLFMNIFFILFFVFTKDSDLFESASVTFSGLTNFPKPYQFLESNGINSLLIQNILFTGLQVSVGMNAFLNYRLGIYYNNLYIEKQKAFVMGVGGDSGVGKSTLTDKITDLVGKSQIVVLNGDDSHKWERGDVQWQYFTHLNPKANYLHKDVSQIYALVGGQTIKRASYNHTTGKFSKPASVEKNKFILFQGLHPFFLEAMRDVYYLKIYVEAEDSLRIEWKLKRDASDRKQSIAQVRKIIEKRKKDAVKFVYPQKKLADWIIRYYMSNGIVCVKYIFRNEIQLEELVHELSKVEDLKIHHEYASIKKQILYFEGRISKKNITEIAYKLYPNLEELINNQPEFRENVHGINQLLFINYLNYFFLKNKVDFVKNNS